MVARCFRVHRILLSKAVRKVKLLKWSVVFGIVALGVACQTEEEEPLPPKSLIIDVMTDLYMADIPMARVSNDMKDSVGMVVRNKIAMQNGITPEELSELIARVQVDPDLNMEISDSVIARLEALKKDMESEE